MTHDEEAALVESLVGCTIVAATWTDADPDHDWTGHEEATLTLDDGRVIQFGGWGHDAWGATVDLIVWEPAEEIRHCAPLVSTDGTKHTESTMATSSRRVGVLVVG